MPDEPIGLAIVIPGERIIELALEIVLEAMKGQTAEQRAQMWDWYIKDVSKWRKFLGIDKD